MQRFNLGIIGAGWPGQQHAIAARSNEEVRLYACADSDEQRLVDFQKEFRPERTFRSYEELIHDRAIDGVVICLPNFLHFPVSLAVLEAGKHVLCEKPPTMTAAEMKILRDKARERKLIYSFSRQFRFTPAMRAAKEAIEQGRLGRIYNAQATFVRSRGIPTWGGGWFVDKKRSGGGALIDIGIHALDAVWFLMGTPRPVSISAKVFRNFPQLATGVPIFDVEDAAYAFIRFQNDAVVQLEACWAGNLPDSVPSRKYFGRELINSMIYGTKGAIRLNPLTLFEDCEGEIISVSLMQAGGEPGGFESQLRNFIGAVRGIVELVNDADQAVALMEMIDAIYLSSELGREVTVAET